MSQVLTFQDAIQNLASYWVKQGCLLWQPLNTEVGAGTMNPATFLRVLGPEPWNVGYVEPSVRPDDSRYGDNPNRVQMHTQYQVILKPDPGNPQELYLGSLEALGIDRRKHDIRFVEDNWESPALGAWGLGWEVWLDGLEITQFTYFQQAGGLNLDPASVEITYGLERILMALQGARHFKDILYAPGIMYGEALGQNEYEMSVYNLDVADTARVGQLFDLYEAEALAMLDKGLPIPAYSYVLKTSHAFNILDARGAIGVTERARAFARMRALSRKVSALWLETREKMDFPLGKRSAASAAAPPQPEQAEWTSDKPQTFVLEIGSEELPAADVELSAAQLREKGEAMLKDLRLSYSSLTVAGTPRRATLIAKKLAPRQSDQEREIKGPPASIAFDKEGNPTKAAQGFAQKAGLPLESLERRSIEGVDYLYAVVRDTGKPAGEALAEALPALLGAISFGKTMRWNSSGCGYSRPIRWIAALLGDQVVPFVFAGTASGRMSRDLRNARKQDFEIKSADAYLGALSRRQIVLEKKRREEIIRQEGFPLAASVGGRVPESAQGDLLAEVANLIECPTPILGAFEEKYLELPREVLVTVMRKHQRYFPIEDEAGKLLPYFLAVANGEVDKDVVRAGNEAVLRARYADAAFFWKNDAAKKLDQFRPALNALTFQEKLGSMFDKSERILKLTPSVTRWLDLPPEDAKTAERAAFLAKADLATSMVVELTSLAGIMGRYYALRNDETPEVAQAIFEHTLPRFAGDALPKTKAGVAVAVADRLDSLTGLFAVRMAPKATADPFALRRAALGVVQALVELDLDLDLVKAIDAAAQLQPVPVSATVKGEVLDFVVRRMEQWLLDQGRKFDLVQAVLVPRGPNPALAARTLGHLAALADTERFRAVLTAYSRPARIVRGQEIGVAVNPELFEKEEERALWEAAQRAAAEVDPQMPVADFLDAFEPLVAPIGRFFDEVFVMVDDEAVRQNRLALLKALADLSQGILDFSRIEGF